MLLGLAAPRATGGAIPPSTVHPADRNLTRDRPPQTETVNRPENQHQGQGRRALVDAGFAAGAFTNWRRSLNPYAQEYRAKRATLYLTIVDGNGAEVRINKTGELTILPLPERRRPAGNSATRTERRPRRDLIPCPLRFDEERWPGVYFFFAPEDFRACDKSDPATDFTVGDLLVLNNFPALDASFLLVVIGLSC